MAVERLDSSNVARHSVEELGLDAASVNLASEPALAASIRRAASFLCPTTPGGLLRAVIDVLLGLPQVHEGTKAEIQLLLETLVSSGDLLELPMDDAGGKRRHLFLGPPAYVRRRRSFILVGVRPEAAPILSDELGRTIEYHGHVRLLRSDDATVIDEILVGEGLIEMQADQWLKAPRATTPEDLLNAYASRLEAAGPSGDIEGVSVLDPESDVSYYRGRWRPLKRADHGRYVARRPQAFGADLWCFAEVVKGDVIGVVDLPVVTPLARGSDEAWRLQAALDAVAGRPQRVCVRDTAASASRMLELFSPLPSWSQRRLDFVGVPAAKARGALLSYAVRSDDVDEEVGFLERMLWLSVETAAPRTNGQ